ncbi:hypothetical protein [Nonomuraea recticatena]|uniref:Uncharacterized protein n=1 Tax=Nonomuraea recticatena TaxID=46178 RepID=A0ABP6FRS4_9ACTN
MSGCCGPILVGGGGGTPADPGFVVTTMTLCDDNGPFVRRYTFDAERGAPSGVPVDTTLDGAGYAPVGAVTVCTDSTAPAAQQAQAHRFVFEPSGAPGNVDVLGLAAGPVESITITVVAAAGAAITTVDGVSDLYSGESHTWSALGDVGVGSDQLVGPVQLAGNPGTVVIIVWTERL